MGVSVASNLDHGHVNPITSSEFTIFTPLSPPHQNNNVFLANQQIITRVDEDYRSGDIDLTDWYSSSHISAIGEKEFPRTQLKYIRELGKGWFGRIVEGTATGLPSTANDHSSPSHHKGTKQQHITASTTIDHPLATPSISNGTNSSSAPRWAPVIVRILDAGAGANQRLHFLHDVTIYRVSEHANLLRLEGRCLDSVPLLLLQEYCAKGDLKQYLLSQKASGEKFLTSELPLRWCWQLASALKHLHFFKLAHPDLATRNCQLDDNLQLKLGDYGNTVAKYPEDYYHGSEVVPVRWRAPETIIFTATTIQQKKVNAEGNIWSLGICMWEIYEFGALPYSWLNNDEVVSQVLGPSNIRLPKPTSKILYTDYIFRLMQLCWSTVESRPAITQIELMLLDLLQVYQHTQETNSEHSSNAPVSLQDFDNRWDNFKPNTIVKTDNQQDSIQPSDTVTVLNFNNAVNSSPSLKNLAGSLDNLLDSDNKQLDSWLENVASSTGDLSYVKGLSDAINDLDNAIALENISSSESSSRPNSGNVKHARNKLQFKLGPMQSKSNYLTSDSNKNSLLIPRTSSESETEDENWKRKIERGAYTEKVRQKSRSVADLMILTHIDTSESDSETMPSLDTRVSHKNSLLFGSEGNLLNVESRFQEELRKLQVERRDSLLFVPERKSSLIAEEQQNTTNLPIYNVYNVVTISPVKVPNINLEEIINYEKDLELDRQHDSPDIVTNKYLKENNIDVPDIISSCNGTVDVGSSNASTETLDKLENVEVLIKPSSSSSIFKPVLPDVSSTSNNNKTPFGLCGIVPKLTEIIENNSELMDYIIEKYDSDGGLLKNDNTSDSGNKTGEIQDDSLSNVVEAVNLNCTYNNCENSNKIELTNNYFESYITPLDDNSIVEAINPNIKTDCEQFVSTLISAAIDVYTNNQKALIRATQDFINTEIDQYEDSIKMLNFNQEESSVILGACDDYSIDLYASLKTTVDTTDNNTVIPAPLQQIYSSAKSEVAVNKESPSKINFSLETWDKFLGSSFERNEDYEDTGMFSQPQSLLFIENSSKLESNNSDNVGILNDEESFLQQLTNLDDVKSVEIEIEDVLNSTYILESKDDECANVVPSEANDSQFDGLDVSDINIELDDAHTELNNTFTFNEEESIWKSTSDGGWFLHPQVDGILTGNILKPMGEGDDKDFSAGFDVDDDILAAVRSELMAKLPHAQRASNDHVDDSDDSEASTSSDKNEIVMSYNYYNKQLSPILEESYSELLNSGQSTPNCTINSTSSSSSSSESDDDTNGTNGNNTWSDSPDHSVSIAAKVSSHNVSDSEDDSPQLPVDVVTSQVRQGLETRRPITFLQENEILRRNDDSISEGCLTRSEFDVKSVDVVTEGEIEGVLQSVDLLTGHVPKDEDAKEEGALRLAESGEMLTSSIPVQTPTNLTLLLNATTTSFLDHERTYSNIPAQQQQPPQSQSINLPRLTLTNNTQLEESSTSSDTTYVTASDGSLSSGSTGQLFCFGGGKGGAIVPPLNSPEDRLPWRPAEDVVGLGGGLLQQVEQQVFIVQEGINLDDENVDEEYDLIPNGEDMIEISCAFLDETSGSAGNPSSDEKQLSQDSDTMPIDELQALQQQEKEPEEVIEIGNIQEDGEKGGNNDGNEYDDRSNIIGDATYSAIDDLKMMDKAKKGIDHEYDDVIFHDHHYINQEKVPSDNNTNQTLKSLEYSYASYMNRLNTKHLNATNTNTDDSSTINNLYDDVPCDDNISTIEEYANISRDSDIEDHKSLSPQQEDYVNITPQSDKQKELEDYVNVTPQTTQNEQVSSGQLRDYVNVPQLTSGNKIYSGDTLRDYVNTTLDSVTNERVCVDTKQEGEEYNEGPMSPPSEFELYADVLEDEVGDAYTPLEDIRFEGPAADLHLMSTSFSDSNDLGDEHDEDWDSGSDTGSSSSGLFIWKHTEQISPLDEIREESEDTSSGSDVDDDADGIEFVPSAWDKYALPAKSALRSPEKTLELKRKGVWFKKQKYHCIYEYPKEPESPLTQQNYDLWQPAPEYPMCPAEWDLDGADALSSSSSSSDVIRHSRANDHHLPDYNIDEDFYIRSASKPFELSSLYTAPGPGQSQFFPGGRSVPIDGPVDYWLRPINNGCISNGNGTHGVTTGTGGSSGYGSEVSTTPTPDSGAEDSGASSGELLSDGSEQGPLPLKMLCQVAATANGLLNHHHCAAPIKDGVQKMVAEIEIGGLRHTRNRLKLDLPPSPSAFTSNKAFNVGNVNEDDEPIVKRGTSMTFSTFGKSRFLVQQVATPPDDDSSRTTDSNGRSGKNVSFEALPYKPRLALIESNYGNYNNQCSSSSSQNSSREDLYSSKEQNNADNNVTTSILGGCANSIGKVEVVRGEASLLDSADEDSGIESSTLDRKRKPTSLSSSPSVLTTAVTSTIMEI